MKKIVFTGGGTAGHVTPNIALIRRLQADGWQVHYIGTKDGMENVLIHALPNVEYHTIASGKLRRYFSWQNFIDPFRVLKGVGQSFQILKQVRPDVIFSKGGFVSVPVVIAAGKTHVVAHESDYSPGLANRIASHFSDTICVTFEDTLQFVNKKKGVFTGTPIRPELYAGNRERGLKFTGLSGKKPVLLIMGGSLGAQRLNELVHEALPMLLARFEIAHLCGRSKVAHDFDCAGYVQYEYITDELPDLVAMADVVLSRAGGNAVFEFLALQKPAVFVPLTSASTRGDQIQNAEYCVKKGYALSLDQRTATADDLVAALDRVYRERDAFKERMRLDTRLDGTDEILAEIQKAAGVQP